MGRSNSFYKMLEKEWNNRIHAQCNNRTFTKAFGEALDAHLDHVIFQKSVIANWLKTCNLPNKDELADLAEKVINCEEKLDTLEEFLYTITKVHKENQIPLMKLKESIEEVREIFTEELKAIKVQNLEDELADLKKLFN